MNREELFRHLKKVAGVISSTIKRQEALKSDLDYVTELWKEGRRSAHSIGSIIRLNHEVMFLCIDTYSMYKGMELKKSLYSKILNQNGRFLSKVDKTPFDESGIIDLGIVVDDQGTMEPTTPEMHQRFVRLMNEMQIQERQKLKAQKGVPSKNEEEIKAWWERVKPCQEIIEKLAQKRDHYAHRLDTLDDIESEIVLNPTVLREMYDSLSCAREVLVAYEKILKNIFGYALSEQFLGMNLVYRSPVCPQCRRRESK